MIFGRIYFEIPDDRAGEVYRIISDNKLSVSNICSEHGILRFTADLITSSLLEKEFAVREIAYKITARKGPAFLFKRLFAKKGMIFGSIVSVCVLFTISGYVFSFDILNSSLSVRRDIMAVLREEGVTAGKSIKDIDLTVVERALKQRVNGISWAGISVVGCKMVIDTVDDIPKPEFTQSRLPTNLIARENGVIEKIELLDGILMKPIGSGVVKGDTVVSGKVVTDRVYYKDGEEMHDIHKRYTRSIAKVYGTFERTFKVTQPLTETVRTLDGTTVTRSCLTLFDTNIPLFFSESDNLSCKNTTTTSLTLFGLELPLSITKETLEGYSYTEISISESHARTLAEHKVAAYEKNFLSDFEIKGRNIVCEKSDNCIIITVNYSLYGEICEEVEFFVDK